MRYRTIVLGMAALCALAAPAAHAQEPAAQERWEAAKRKYREHVTSQPGGAERLAEDEQRRREREAEAEATARRLAGQQEAERLAAEKAAREERERLERVARYRTAVDFYHRAAREIMPGITEPLIDYSTLVETGPSCDAGDLPRTHAILIGSDNYGNKRLRGPVNDVRLMETMLAERGVDRAHIHALVDDTANRRRLAETFLEVLADIDCEDRLIIHFSGLGFDIRTFACCIPTIGGDNPFKQEWEELGSPVTYEQLLEAFAAGELEFTPQMRFFVENAFDPANTDLGIALNDDSETNHEVVLGRDLSDYVVAIRNKGAHAVVLLDTVNAAAANLQERQRAAGEETAWNFVYDPDGGGDDDREPRGNLLLPGHGDFTVFYAAGADQTTPEMKLPRGDPDALIFGLLSYTVASAMMVLDATPRAVADYIQQSYRASGRKRPHPRVDSSQPDLLLLAEAARAGPGESPIHILSPTPKRGAASVDRQEIEIEGIVEWPARVLGVHVGQQQASLDAEGRFSATVGLNNGMNRVDVVAVTADSRMHLKTLEFVYEGDRAALEGEGHRYAVIIANQNYGGTTGFTSLATPAADAEALAALLTTRYGFETELSAGGAVVRLLLKDATKRDIQLALHHVGKAVGEKDTVLVYYAGHGIYEPVTSTAYWVPADAEEGFEPSYLSAADISAAIQRMQAGSVVLISDSCYSGALMRGAQAAGDEVADEERLQSLLRLQSRRSRVVITSGNNEPVEDLGGQGHSIFARALLTGLEAMEHDAFSARELFDDYILHAVTANADQEPQYRPLEKVGHEGGDFVFVRTADMATAD